MDKEVRKILLKAVDLERWGDKVDKTYTFLDEDEKNEIVERIVKQLKVKGFFINKLDSI